MSAPPVQADGRRLIRVRNRERLLTAAARLFAQRGYRGTTTRDIAEEAGITERTLFRHVCSKAELFREAVISPVEAFVDDFRSGWQQRPRGDRDAEVEIRDFLSSLIAILEDERQLLMALLAAFTNENDGEELPELEHTLVPLLMALDEIVVAEAETRGWRVDPMITVRAVVGIALTMTVHADWLFAGHQRPARDHLVTELAQLATWGVAGRPE